MSKVTSQIDSASEYKLGYYQGISDLMCEIHSLNVQSVNLNGFSLSSIEKSNIINIICAFISEKSSKLMQKNGKDDYDKNMKQ